MTTSTTKTIAKYSVELANKAFYLHDVVGNGDAGVALELGVRFNTARALINAGRELNQKGA